MRPLQEIEDSIRAEVARCKGTTPDLIDVNDPLIEVIGLHGDDLMAVAAYVHRKYAVYPRKDAYGAGLTVKEWARIMHEHEPT